MFYSQFILAKKGPLGTIWIAAHLERKLRKNQVADTDIGVSVDSILFPEVPIALRLSSHLLLGVVRIYSRKVNYLFDDCSEALLKVKQAFRSTAVDLPPEQSKAPYHSITLPETFDLDDFEIPDNELFHGNYVDHHVSAREQITLQDTVDGVGFPTSQFGPDERFGDGDASQIGLDLDEDLFLDKNEAAGTSGVLMDMNSNPQASLKTSSPSKDDDHCEGIPDPSLASSASNSFCIQAPSTPGLMEPNLHSNQEALVSDDHLDEDHNPLEFAAKDVSEPSSSHLESGTVDFHANGNDQHLLEQETKTMELIPTGNTLAVPSNEHFEATNSQYSAGNTVSGSLVENETNTAADIELKRHSEVDEAVINKISVPSPEIAPVTEVHSCVPCAGSYKADLNGFLPIMSNSKSEDDESSNGSEVTNLGETCQVVSNGFEPLNEGQPCLVPEIPETNEANVDNRLSPHAVHVLQACSSLVQNACDGVNGLANASCVPAKDDGLCSLGIPGREDSTKDSGFSAEIQDSTETNLKTDQITHQCIDADNSCFDGKLENMMSQENILEKENDCEFSDFPAPEMLLSVPNVSAVQPDDLFVECTPAKNDLVQGDGDATMEKMVSGRKRSYTESTLTIQSLNSADSCGATQSKRSMKFIPDDDDLLSSILVGGKSTALKMKSTPPVTDRVPAKRQRVAVRASSHKRKVLVDDALVLHGDTIRQQLTNTEDIRRVRKKAPCTCLETWMLQRQFLEDEIFNEPIFTGTSAALTSLHGNAFDLSRTRVVEEGSKGSNKLDTSAGATLGEEAGHVGAAIPLASSDDGNRNLGGSLEVPCHIDYVLGVDGNSLPKAMMAADDEVTKEGSEYHASGEKVVMDLGNERLLLGSEAMGAEQASGLDPVSYTNCNSIAEATVSSSDLKETGDVDTVHIDASCRSLDVMCEIQSTKEDASMVEHACEAGVRGQEGVDVTENLNLDVKLDTKYLSEETEGVDGAVSGADGQDHCSPLHNVIVNDTVPLENEVCATFNQVMEGCHPDESILLDHRSLPAHGESVALDHDGSGLTSNNLVSKDLNLDASCSVETDLSSQNNIMLERENLVCWDAEPKVVMDSATIDMDCIYTGEHADFGIDAMEHDTDFLNVDDDEVGEDYETSIPNAEEKRTFDNSGWSARTKAVANYLQVLFEKEAQHGKDISLDSLLTGKSRKEASRMFFETLVLKTKDYIQAEQENSFHDIRIMPRGKLMKSEF